jgi:alpha-L-rhamnosidase
VPRTGSGRFTRVVALVAVAAAVLSACANGSHRSSPHGLGAPSALTVDGLASPIGLDPTDVAFAWHVNDARRGAQQSAYRIVVSEVTVGGKGDGSKTLVWNSGEVPSRAQAFVAYGGARLRSDAVYEWTVQTWDRAGRASPIAAGAQFETGLVDSDWVAKWIRRPADVNTEPDQYTYARKDFTLSKSPIVRARAYVSADQQYEMDVNGVRVGKGEAYSFPDSQYYETLDLTRALHAGPNAVGVLYNWQGPTKGHPAGEPGVIAELRITQQDGLVSVIGTDGTWRVRKGAWLNPTQRDLEGDLVDFTEHVNGPDEPLGWDKPGFDASTWALATVVGPAGTPPWTHLVSVRTRIVYQPVRAVSLTRLPNGAFVADFGKVYAAIPTVTFRHGVRGHVVPMHAGYLLDHCPDPAVPAPCVTGAVSVVHGTQHTDMSYSYTQRGGGTETFQPFDYLGFRYLQIDAPGEPLHAGDVVALARHTAMPEEPPATFTSSDATLDSVFALAAHSALYTAQEQYIDTPTREKGPWLWDGYDESEAAMASFGEQNLSRKSLLEFAQSQSRYWPNGAVNKIYPTGLGALDINEFTEIYPQWVWQYWLNTGDRALLSRVYPVVESIAGYVDRSIDPTTGLVKNLPSTSIYYQFPTVTRINVLAVNDFRIAADIATMLRRPDAEIARQRARQEVLTNAINSRLTRPDGTYVDGLNDNGTQVTTSAQETNACALYYDVVPATHVPGVARYIASLGLTAPPRTASEVIGALAHAGRYNDVIRILTDRRADGWANIIAQGGTFTWEVWRPSDIIGDSMSHGWGANVLVEMQRALLGVTTDDPGYATFTVSPPLAELDHAAGSIPAIAGTINVSWTRRRNTFTIDITVPPNTSATLRVAATDQRAITEGGRPLARSTAVSLISLTHGLATIGLGAGTYRFVVSR